MRHYLRAGLATLLGGVAAALALHGGAVSAAGLGIGDPAPPIIVNKFVKGASLTKAPAGKVSVVEFWATWCGPCRVSIPHLTGLAHKYPQVRFVGVSVWERDQSAVAPFVQKMGTQMDYTVAMDRVSPGTEGVMAKTWMDAAGQRGIPTAFIVGPSGRIAWIGHPMALDAPLAKIVAGQWNAAAAKTQFQTQQAQQKELTALRSELRQAQQSGDPRQVIAVINRAIAADPRMETPLGGPKFLILLKTGQQGPALAYGDHLVNGTYRSTPEALNALAWELVDPAKPRPQAKVAAFALRAAQRADTAAGQKSAAIADTLAAAYYAAGDSGRAVKTQERAIRLAQGAAKGADAGLAAHLALYQKAVASR